MSELPIVACLSGLKGDEDELLNKLLGKYNLELIAYTKGEKGSILITDTEKSFINVPKVKVVDTVGAGDSFTATLVAGLLQSKKLREIHFNATQVAAFVCTQKGATPEVPAEILNNKNQ